MYDLHQGNATEKLFARMSTTGYRFASIMTNHLYFTYEHLHLLNIPYTFYTVSSFFWQQSSSIHTRCWSPSKIALQLPNPFSTPRGGPYSTFCLTAFKSRPGWGMTGMALDGSGLGDPNAISSFIHFYSKYNLTNIYNTQPPLLMVSWSFSCHKWPAANPGLPTPPLINRMQYTIPGKVTRKHLCDLNAFHVSWCFGQAWSMKVVLIK